MAVTRKWRVHGSDGHRQAASFGPSIHCDWREDGKTRIVALENADKTGTNEFTRIIITRDTAEECLEELNSQVSDGFFENYRTGDIVEEFGYV